MTLVMDKIEKGDTYMQEVMRIGDKFVPADKYIKDISNASTEINEVAQKYKTDMLAVIGKGDKHQIVTQHHENMYTKLEEDLAKVISLVETVADSYNVDAIDVADAVKRVINNGE